MNRYNIAVTLLGVLVALSAFLYIKDQSSNEVNIGTELPQAVALFETSLASPMTADATSMTLTSNSVRGGGSVSGYNCFTIDEGSAQAEFVCGTASGTAVTGLLRGISPLDGVTEDSDLKFPHRRGASVKITDFPIIQLLRAQNNGNSTFENVLSYDSAVSIATSSNQIPYASWVQQAITNQSVLLTTNQSISGNKNFLGNIDIVGTLTALATSTLNFLSLTSGTVSTTPSANFDIANKAYVDSVAIAGASNANETTKGIVEEATTAEVLAGTDIGGTGAKLFIPPSKIGDGFAVGTATSSIAVYGQSTSTFSISSNQAYIIYASGTCNDTQNSGLNAVVSMYVDGNLVRQLNNFGTEADGANAGTPWSMTYASSSPSQTTVDVRLYNSGAGCGTFRDVTIDYLAIPK